jgi:general secretion pathway protein N
MALDRSPRSPSAAAVWAWAVVGLAVGAVVAVLFFAPATWLARAVNAIGQGRVVLSDSTGTVWSGSARLALAGGAGSRDTVRLPGRVEWVIAPGWGALSMKLLADCCTPEPVAVVLTPQWQGLHLQVLRSQSSWPASLLAGLGTPWNTLQLQGNLVLTTPGFTLATSLDRWTLQGDVQLEAQDLQSRVSSLRPLGSYQLRVAGGAQPSLALTTLRGDLQLGGQGRWTAGRLRFEGEARATPDHAQELSNLLNIMGRRDGARSIITLG